MSEELIIRCPSSGHKFKIKADAEVLKTGYFKCPKCGYTAPFPVVLKWNEYENSAHHGGKKSASQPMAPQPQLSPAQSAALNCKTKIANGSNGANSPIINPPHAAGPHLCVPSVGLRIPLQVGNYVLGRKSSDSQANIHIAPDPYMSRQHAFLQVIRTATGISLQIKPLNQYNPVYVNKVSLNMNENRVLRKGDTIVMGKTLLKVE